MRAALRGRLLAGSLVIAATLALAVALGRPLSAQQPAVPPQPIDSSGLYVVGHNNLGQVPGDTSDVWVLGDTAYTGYRCPDANTVGSSVIDVSDPANPTVLFQTPVDPYWFANDVKALRMDTAAFTGDILIEPLDGPCSTPEDSLLPPGSTRFWDVSDPKQPQLLSTLVHGDGVHNCYPFNRGDQSFVILAAPGADTANNDTDTRQYEDIDLDADLVVVEITDPRNPEIIGRWNAHDVYPEASLMTTFQHDTWVNAAGTMIYGAYWDLGMVLIDLQDPTNPTAIGKIGYADRAAGNTHAVIPTKDEKDVVITDEVFTNTATKFEVLTPAGIAGEKPAVGGGHIDKLLNLPGLKVEGEMAWVGRGCDADPAYGIDTPDPYLNDASGKIALILRGDCSFAGKIRQAQENGAIGAIVVNNTPGSGPPPMGGGPRSDTTIPGWGIGHDDGNAITTTLESGVASTGRAAIIPDAFGFTRFADVSDPANPKMHASEITIPQTRQVPAPPGTWSVHNPWLVDDQLFLSYYSSGVRGYDISDIQNPIENLYAVLAVPLADGTSRRNSVWGVITQGDYIYVSDINNGFWILAEGEIPTAPTFTPVPPTITPTPPPTDTPVPATATPVPTDTPEPTEDLGRVCPQILHRVPPAAIAAAIANPAAIDGYMKPHDSAKPIGPNNPLRTWLSMRNLAAPYHPLFNGLLFRAGCP